MPVRLTDHGAVIKSRPLQFSGRFWRWHSRCHDFAEVVAAEAALKSDFAASTRTERTTILSDKTENDSRPRAEPMLMLRRFVTFRLPTTRPLTLAERSATTNSPRHFDGNLRDFRATFPCPF